MYRFHQAVGQVQQRDHIARYLEVALSHVLQLQQQCVDADGDALHATEHVLRPTRARN